jgi:hypothetical protein
MKTVKIVPSICKGDDSHWTGHVVMRLPTFDEKFEYLENLGVNFSDSGAVVESEGGNNRVKQLRKMVDLSKKHYVEVSLKNVDTGEEINSLEDMTYNEDCHKALIEIATMMLQGFKLGNA